MKLAWVSPVTLMFLIGCTLQPLDSENADLTLEKSNLELNQISLGEFISVEDIHRDITEIRNVINSVHPDPSFTMDVEQVEAKLDAMTAMVHEPLTKVESWKLLSQLNPLFNDGHMAITYPDLDMEFTKHQLNGGRTFPFEVHIDSSNRLYAIDSLNSTPIKTGDQIIAINGSPASDIVESILTRMHGDSSEHRRSLASKRFSKMYWALFGSSDSYQIDVKDNQQNKRCSVLGREQDNNPAVQGIEAFVQYKILDENLGYLKIDRFYYPPNLEKPYFDFMQAAWRAFKEAKVEDVIIDVRENPGGTDHYWQLGIAPYITNQPFPFLSYFKMRMTELNIKKGPIKGTIGTVMEGPFSPMVPIKKDNDLRISGQAYLLMGSQSYSSTVLFLTALKDSSQAIIAGVTNGVRSCTTGRIESTELSGSHLNFTLPTLIYTRPAGNNFCSTPIKPDLLVESDPLRPDEVLKSLVKKISQNK